MLSLLAITLFIFMASHCYATIDGDNYCNSGAVYNNQTGNCVSCSTGEYSQGPYATECLKCPPFRVATLSSGCGGLDPAQVHDGLQSCTCDSYWIGLEATKANGIAIAMMIVYFALVAYSVNFVLTTNASISKIMVLKLAFTILLSALDTTTDLLYILTSEFGYPILFALCIFFYLANIFAYLNYLRVHKPGIVSSMITLPAQVTNACNNRFLIVFLVIPYYFFMLIKSIVLFLAGYCLYTSKLLLIGPIHNTFFELFTNSKQFATTQLLDNQSFTEGVYYELFFESLPQIVIQVRNWQSTYFGGSILTNKPLLASVISSVATFLFHITILISYKCSCKSIKTGFEDLVFIDSRKVDDSIVGVEDPAVNHIEVANMESSVSLKQLN